MATRPPKKVLGAKGRAASFEVKELDPAQIPQGYAPSARAKLYKVGECAVITDHDDMLGWIMRVVHPRRTPTLREIVFARRLVPLGRIMAVLVPPYNGDPAAAEQYVDVVQVELPKVITLTPPDGLPPADDANRAPDGF